MGLIMAGINDVAKKAGVAKSTVSLVCNNSGYVSTKTRNKVEKAMKELNYIPNQIAKNLSQNRSNIIGIVMPDIMHPFFSTFIKYAEKNLHDYGYMTMVCSTISKESIEQEYLNMLNRKVMDGIIVGTHTLDVERYKEVKYPIVSIDRYISQNIPLITSNHIQSAQLTSDVIISNGCKNVVQFTGSGKVMLAANDYALYCKEILEQNNININFINVGFNTFDLDGYKRAAKLLFEQFDNVDAVIGVDMVILSVMKLAIEKGYKIPKDLKLVAHDGTYVTQMGAYNISSIVQPIDEIAKNAVKTIINMINGKGKVENLKVLDTSFRKGNTTI